MLEIIFGQDEYRLGSKKNEWLILNKGISFEEITAKLVNGEYHDIFENPTRGDQLYFVLELRSYTWVVHFLVNERDEIVIKTAFPSRKFHVKYGDKDASN